MQCQWVVYQYQKPHLIFCYNVAVEKGLCEQHLREWETQRKVAQLKKRYGFHRPNPDESYRQLERRFYAEGTQELFNQLAAAYQRAGREFDYLNLLEQHGPELYEHARTIISGGYQRQYVPKLTPEQEARYLELVWQQLRNDAAIADQTQSIDLTILERAEQLVNRLNFSPWARSLWLVKRTDDPLILKSYRNNLDDYSRRLDDEILAKLICLDHEEDLEIYPTANAYIEAWSEVPEWYPDLEKWLFEYSNQAAIEWIYEHRNCLVEPEPYPGDEPPYDTPSLPPTGTQDPNW